ncbi:hypothetical protein AGLY_017923 [Aphis glycines]|uniref:Uncharacterized protein n=1 Tax=Aphis glycines TaxID=307491 RepID=A0A6G0STP4_APHGL|nr:hypothetical protein AGLY_017923 [Aphis glycines]
MRKNVKSEHFPTVFIRIEINKKKNDRKRQILLSQNVYVSVNYISEIFFFVSLYNITSRKNPPITNFEVAITIRYQILRVVFDRKSKVLDAQKRQNFTKCLCICYLCIVEFSKRFLKFFFFVSLYNITSRKNAPITNFEGGFRLQIEISQNVYVSVIYSKECSDYKLWGWFSTANRMSLMLITVKSEHFPTVFKIIEINKKKNDRNRQILHKTGIRPNRYLNKILI